MKKLLLIAAAVCLLCGCQSAPTVKNKQQSAEQIDDNKHEKQTVTNKTVSEEPEIIIPFDFLSAEVSFDEAESVSTSESMYTVKYGLCFEFINKDSSFTVDYVIYDADNNELIRQSGVRPEKTDAHSFRVFRHIDSPFSISVFRYVLTAHYDGQDYEYIGECPVDNSMTIADLKVGPMITKYESDSLITYLSINATISGERGIQWVRLIPPSAEYFWDIPFEREGFVTSAMGTVSDTRHKRYFDNGDYILQINAGRSGIIQKKISITDYFNNTSGANYGFPVASELESDKNKIVLDMNFREKMDRMEVLIYTDYEGVMQKLGTAKLLMVREELAKKDLMKAFTDDFGNKVKLKNNKTYYYQVYLYSKEFNELTYISVSELIPIVFQGFSLW